MLRQTKAENLFPNTGDLGTANLLLAGKTTTTMWGNTQACCGKDRPLHDVSRRCAMWETWGGGGGEGPRTCIVLRRIGLLNTCVHRQGVRPTRVFAPERAALR